MGKCYMPTDCLYIQGHMLSGVASLIIIIIIIIFFLIKLSFVKPISENKTKVVAPVKITLLQCAGYSSKPETPV